MILTVLVIKLKNLWDLFNMLLNTYKINIFYLDIELILIKKENY
jgi:hypothetical protein